MDVTLICTDKNLILPANTLKESDLIGNLPDEDLSLDLQPMNISSSDYFIWYHIVKNVKFFTRDIADFKSKIENKTLGDYQRNEKWYYIRKALNFRICDLKLIVELSEFFQLEKSKILLLKAVIDEKLFNFSNLDKWTYVNYSKYITKNRDDITMYYVLYENLKPELINSFIRIISYEIFEILSKVDISAHELFLYNKLYFSENSSNPINIQLKKLADKKCLMINWIEGLYLCITRLLFLNYSVNNEFTCMTIDKKILIELMDIFAISLRNKCQRAYGVYLDKNVYFN